MANGRIFSIESMGLVDGPGIRTVVFFRGCPLRCVFCHNPDSWANDGEEISAEELMKKILRFRPYFERSGGGITCSGGEPLLQKDFLIDLLTRCKQAGIHTCLDTSGVGVGGYDEILPLCDLVLLDVKATNEKEYRTLCNGELCKTEEFIKAINRHKTPVVVRRVVIPNVNDTDEAMIALRDYVEKNLPTAIKVELLPYHKMGVYKYKALGLCDPLENTPPMDKQTTKDFQEKYFKDCKGGPYGTQTV